MPGQRSIEGRRILLTGASRGVGRALGIELAPLGMHFCLVARSESSLTELAEELDKLGAASVLCFAGDIVSCDTRAKLIELLRDEWGSIDILVNNAGTSAHGRFVASDESTLRGVMELNFFAATELTRLSLPLLSAGKDPVIVNVGSVLGHRGAPYNSEYSASKFALRGWSEAVRAELSREGIDVVMISPGTIDTQFFDHLLARHEETPWPKQKGISPEATALQIANAIRRRKREIYPNWRGRVLVAASRYCPALVDRLMKRYG